MQITKYGKAELRTSEIIDNLLHSLIRTINGIREDSALTELGLKSKKDGLVIFIDEADNLSPLKINLGAFLKNITEALMVNDCDNVLFIIAGLPRICEILRRGHESSLRIFEEHELNTLSDDDIAKVIDLGLNKVKQESAIEITIDSKAHELIKLYSEGYPHFVQQIGYSILQKDNDNHISEDDVNKSFWNPGGALERIGERYYRDLYYGKIKQESYRQILRIMADKFTHWIKKSDIKKQFKGKAASLDNGIKALLDRNIILPKKGVRGIYKLQWNGFAAWIRFETERKSN